MPGTRQLSVVPRYCSVPTPRCEYHRDVIRLYRDQLLFEVKKKLFLGTQCCHGDVLVSQHTTASYGHCSTKCPTGPPPQPLLYLIPLSLTSPLHLFPPLSTSLPTTPLLTHSYHHHFAQHFIFIYQANVSDILVRFTSDEVQCAHVSVQYSSVSPPLAPS